jgi:iron complex outermembrane receptor protein
MQGSVRDWDYQAAVSYVANREVPYHVSGEVSEAAFGPLLRSGVVNPFAPNSAEVLRQMQATQIVGQDSDNRASNYGADFKVTREVASLAAGPLAVAFGGEARRERLEMVNAEFLYTGDIVGGTGALPSFTASNRKVASLYAEANVPITGALEANLAVRTDHYSDFGTTTNPKLSLRWRASPQAVVRAAYGTGFRAPTLFELFLPVYDEGFVEGVSDPVRCPVTHSPDDCDTAFPGKTGGNPALKPEKSRQLNVGVVLEPAKGFSVSLDYYRVEVRELMSTITLDAALATYNVRKPPDAQYPDLPGPIEYLADFKYNVGTLTTSGSDIDLRWRFPATSMGQATLSVTGTYVIDYDVANGNTAAPEGAGRRGLTDGAVSRWRHYAMLDWSMGPWGATLAQNFQLGYKEVDRTTCADITQPLTRANCPGDRRVGSYSVLDLQGRYNGFASLSLSFGVRNLLDRAPPVSNQGSTFIVGVDPNYADARGRTWYAGARYAFK